MGKKRSRGRKGGKDEWNGGSQKPVVKSNARMEDFYRHQAIVPDDEWDCSTDARIQRLVVAIKKRGKAPHLPQ